MKTGACKFAIVVAIGAIYAGRSAAPIGAGDLDWRAVVTVNTKSAEDTTTVPQQTISVYENRKLQEVTGWVPLRGERSGLQLVVLLDDSSRGNLGLQLNESELSDWAAAHRAGSDRLYAQWHAQSGAELHQRPRAGSEVSAPATGSAGINGSPYFCLSDLVKHWPGGDSNVRREVIMVTDGVDRYSGGRFDPENPYVQAATSDAQKAGVIVYSIYYRGAGALGPECAGDGWRAELLTQVSGCDRRQGLPGGLWQPGVLCSVSFRYSAQTAEPIRVDLRLHSETGAAADPGENQPAKHQPGVSSAGSSRRGEGPSKTNRVGTRSYSSHKIQQEHRRGERCQE